MEPIKEIKETKRGCCSTRDVLWYLVFFGFGVNYMIRINLNIAIVSMVRSRPKDNVSLTSECIPDKVNIINNNSFTANNAVTANPLEIYYSAVPRTLRDIHLNRSLLENFTDRQEKLYDWNEKQQGIILGSFFWCHWVLQVPGGLLATKYGTKKVFGLSNFVGVILCYFIPFAASFGATYLMILRLVQGFILGLPWPSMHYMTARWIPPNERSKFVTSYLGSSVGAAFTYSICGVIIDMWGWQLVFYVCGILGTLWFAAWWLLVYDSPSEHPRISNDERDYIVESLGQSIAKKQAPVPWSKILSSVSVWMNMLAQLGGLWGFFTLMTHGPTYFKFIHGWNIKATGFLSGLPHLLRMLWAFIFSLLGDYLLRSNKMSRTNVRKLATVFCTIVQGLFMLFLAYSGCNHILAIIFLASAIAMNGSVSTGPLASIVDISPNYASVLLGLCNTAGTITGLISPVVIGFLTYQNQTVHQWQIVFWISSALLIGSGLLYVFFAKSELKSWNSPNSENGGPESELFVAKKEQSVCDIIGSKYNYKSVECKAEREINEKREY